MRKHLKTYTLSQYIEDDLRPEERKSVDAHLEECGQCRKELLFLRTMILMTARLKDSSVNNLPEFINETMQKKNTLKKVFPFKKFFYPAATAAAVLLFAGAGLFLEINSADTSYKKIAVKKESIKKTVAVKNIADGQELPIVDFEDVVGSSTSIASIVSTLKTNKANITKVSDSYVDAEVEFDDYQRIRDQLGFALVPSGFLGNSVDLASIGSDDTVSSADISPLKTIKIRIRR
jgi:hypothetical protein